MSLLGCFNVWHLLSKLNSEVQKSVHTYYCRMEVIGHFLTAEGSERELIEKYTWNASQI